MVKRLTAFIVIFNVFLTVHAQTLTATSNVNWNNTSFNSQIILDLKMANISLPSGRNAAVKKIQQQLPLLIKSPLLNTVVDDSSLLWDNILSNSLKLENVTEIIQQSNNHTGIYSGKTDSISVNNTINLHEIAALMVKHNTPYQLRIPIEQVTTRKFTGIIIDMRGSFPVHGEFLEDTAVPCFFPKIYDENMNLIYEKNMTDPSIAKTIGIVQYTDSLNEKEYENRIGKNPLRIIARELFGAYRTDPVISRDDALKILSLKENLELLEQGRVVFLMDKASLQYKASAPLKDEPYYFAYQELQKQFDNLKIDKVTLSDSPKGMLISIRELKFVADTAILLDDEEKRLDAIAKTLIDLTKDNENTIIVEGHTASVGKTQGEYNLSLLRAKTIIAEMVKRGVPEEIMSSRGYGGTIPIGDNNTEEGRALNRRVEITIVPKAVYIQRSN
ncbi:MAG: hypothetical protein BKP49_00725 [Treponema sp. CETP13]|nr:MAG: hypothetical protein BKP49_00725 [Treponema sp. CETP13]